LTDPHDRTAALEQRAAELRQQVDELHRELMRRRRELAPQRRLRRASVPVLIGVAALAGYLLWRNRRSMRGMVEVVRAPIKRIFPF
jgi:hypothetical protein